MVGSKNKDLFKKIDFTCLPQHIAIIMDGNGRWAAQRGWPRLRGHQVGLKAVRRIIEVSVELKISVLTLYCFSVDNWLRPEKEIKFLMQLLERYVKKELETFKENNIRLKIIGDITQLPDTTQKTINKAKSTLRENDGLTLVLAINYGGRKEIIKAVQKLSGLVQMRMIEPKEIDENKFSQFLETETLSDPDLLIRTSGERRLSNFLLWQLSYTELYFSEKLWPDFNQRDFLEAILDFQKRKRRYGGL